MKTLIKILFILMFTHNVVADSSMEIEFEFPRIDRGDPLAGPRVGNGGAGWKCTSTTGELEWVKTLDLFELVHEHNLELSNEIRRAKDKDTVVNIVKSKLDKSGHFFELGIDQTLKEVEDKAFFTNSILTITNDFIFRVKPKQDSCLNGKIELTQIANFTDNGDLLIQSELWDKMGPQDKGALFVHEAVYKTLRDLNKDYSSNKTRRIVSYVFSNLNTQNLTRKLNTEFEINSSMHSNNLDFNILPFLLTNQDLNKRIEKDLNEYCDEKASVSCNDRVYFRQKAIVSGDVEVLGDHLDLRLTVKYNFIYQLNGRSDTCVFNVSVLERRLSGESSKKILNIKTKCSEDEDAHLAVLLTSTGEER